MSNSSTFVKNISRRYGFVCTYTDTTMGTKITATKGKFKAFGYVGTVTKEEDVMTAISWDYEDFVEREHVRNLIKEGKQ